MDPEYGQLYRDLYERHWWWRSREKLILDELRRARPSGKWPSILDVGCGDGLFFSELSKCGEVEGVEPEAKLVSREFEHSIHTVPFDDRFQPGKRYDLILMLDVLEHLEDPVAALKSAERLLEPGGTLLLTVPAFMVLFTLHDEINHHRTRYTKRTLSEQIAKTNLSIVDARYFFHWLFPVKLGVRMIQAVTRPSPSPPGVPPQWLNRCLTSISRIEDRVLRPLRLPFGGSLLVLATSVVEQPRDVLASDG